MGKWRLDGIKATKVVSEMGLPSGNDSHSELKNHHAITGKTHKLSMAMFTMSIWMEGYQETLGVW